jgi:glycerophosphoryl diester phosphodiesterase
MKQMMGVLVTCAAAFTIEAAPGGKQLIAHRGASAYAPEHTRAAYLLAIQQGADFVEQDLVLTKDGQLVCLHDVTLERTTNVEDRFPDRFVEQQGPGGTTKHWMAYDFTLEEIKQLDAGSWFDARFAGERVLTFQEAIDLLEGKVGLYPELKSPELYRARGVNLASIVIEALRRNGLDRSDRLILQSFDEATLRTLARELPSVPRVFLMERSIAEQWLSPARLREAAAFVSGIGPAKQILEARPEAVKWAHDAGLTVTPYTFRAGATGRFPSVRDEMRYFLFELGVDALFTDNPDQFPAK